MPPPSSAQDTINLPPDYYGEALRSGYAAWENTGWVRKTDGTPASDVEYVTDGATPRAFIRKYGAMSLVLASIDTSITTMDTLRRLDIAFDGPLAGYPDPIAQEEEGYHKNFHLPWCGPGGKTEIPGYRWIMYPNIYPKIDMYLYCGSRGQKLMFVVRPEGDPANLKMSFSGHDEMDIDVLGNLRMLLQERWVVLPEAVAYQYDENNEILPVSWTAQYEADTLTGEVGFTFDQFDRYKPLVLLIGPPPIMGGPPYTEGVCWGTYFGGNSSDGLMGIAVDDQGAQYVAGSTSSEFYDFPEAVGTVYWESAVAMLLAAFTPNNQLLWMDYFGGTTGNQRCMGVAVRNSAATQIFIGGTTDASDAFLQPSGSAYFDATGSGGNSGYLARFSATTGIMEWSSYFGNGNFTVNNITIDDAGQLLAAGMTYGDLPQHEVDLPFGASQWPYHGQGDGWVAKFTLGEQVLWSTYIGGANRDNALCVKSAANKILLVGETMSPTIDNLNPGNGAYFQGTNAFGPQDAFIKEFNMNGAQKWGSFFGGTGYEGVGSNCAAIDATSGDMYLVGSTESTDLDTEQGDGWYDITGNAGTAGNADGFVAQFNGTDRNDEWISYIGGGEDDHVISVITGPDQDIYLAGYTKSGSFPFIPASPVYSEGSLLGSMDGWIMRFSIVHHMLWSTLFGGNGSDPFGEGVVCLAPFGTDDLYVIGSTRSPNNEDLEQFFPLSYDPVTQPWFDGEFGPQGDAFIARFCLQDVVTGSPTGISTDPGPQVYLSGPSLLTIANAGPGAHLIEVNDGAGRAVWRKPFTSASEQAVLVLPPLPAGQYVCVLDQGSTLHIVITN